MSYRSAPLDTIIQGGTLVTDGGIYAADLGVGGGRIVAVGDLAGRAARRAHEAVPGSQFLELKNCAHWPQWEDPEAFNTAVRNFLLG